MGLTSLAAQATEAPKWDLDGSFKGMGVEKVNERAKREEAREKVDPNESKYSQVGCILVCMQRNAHVCIQTKRTQLVVLGYTPRLPDQRYAEAIFGIDDEQKWEAEKPYP